MSRPGFRQRAAHLSYVAPLIAYLIWLQVGPNPERSAISWVQLLFPALVAGGGLFLAFSALRLQDNGPGTPARAVAWLGGGLNLALLARMALAIGA